MKKLNMVYLILMVVLFQNCMISSFKGVNSNKNECEEKIIFDSNLLFQSTVNDGLTIKHAMIVEDQIQMNIEYLGGCDPKKNQLLTNGIFKESKPVQVHVLLAFEKKDSCNRIIKENICFDLKELSNQYKKGYQVNEGTIIIRLKDYEQKLFYKF